AYLFRTTNALAEHNVIRGGSWPVENASGEFRYNLVIHAGHSCVRQPQSGARIHHNVFMNLGAGITGIKIYNNTFLGGRLATPAIAFGFGGATVASLRNNLFLGIASRTSV